MEATKLIYMDDQDLLEIESGIVDIQPTEDGRVNIILDGTIFYPQGGGQPYDQGTMTNNEVEFEVQEVRFHDGIVYHTGIYKTAAEFKIDNNVKCIIDAERRIFNSHEHSAGHLLGILVENLRPGFIATKGHHFPGECYVSFDGEVPEEEREMFAKQMEDTMNAAIAAAIPVEIKFVEYSQLEELCDIIPLYVPRNKPCRIMRICFDKNSPEGMPKKPITMPCGGTHVKNLVELGRIKIKKISVKKGITKVSYECSGE